MPGEKRSAWPTVGFLLFSLSGDARWGSRCRFLSGVRGTIVGMTVAVDAPVRELSECFDSLRASLPVLGDSDVVQALRDVETLCRQAYSVMLDAVAETEARGIAAREGFGSTQRLLAGVLRLSAGEARARAGHAAAVGGRRGLTGQTLAPRLPQTAAALAAGQLGVGQLRVITETVAALPASVPEPVREQVDADLARHGRDFAPRALRSIAQRLIATLDPDGPEPGGDDPGRCGVSSGCGIAGTGAWAWRAGWIPSTAPWFVRCASSLPRPAETPVTPAATAIPTAAPGPTVAPCPSGRPMR